MQQKVICSPLTLRQNLNFLTITKGILFNSKSSEEDPNLKDIPIFGPKPTNDVGLLLNVVPTLSVKKANLSHL